jgi:hypothetical protein
MPSSAFRQRHLHTVRHTHLSAIGVCLHQALTLSAPVMAMTVRSRQALIRGGNSTVNEAHRLGQEDGKRSDSLTLVLRQHGQCDI